MIISLGLGLFLQGFFHLLTHAVAKANLFIKVGYMMLKKNHHQDSRILKKNFLKNFLSGVFSIYSICSLSGIIFFSGFFSKEKILERVFILKKFLIIITFYCIIFFSLVYGFRLIFLLKVNLKLSKNYKIIKKTKILRILILSFYRVFFGFCVKKYFLKLSFSVSFLKVIYFSLILLSVFVSGKLLFK